MQSLIIGLLVLGFYPITFSIQVDIILKRSIES